MLRSPQEPAARTPEPHADLTGLEDAELLARMARGDELAFGQLFQRHVDAVRSYAVRTYGYSLDPDDLAAEAFFRVLQAVRRGTARIEHPRAYLLTVTRRIAMEWNAKRHDVPVSDDELSTHVEATGDRSAHSAERHLIARAFANLPERWRSVLWRVEVEGERPAAVGGHFGLSANAAAALARRARDGLRAAYLQAHIADGRGPVSCRSVADKLGAYTTGSVRGAERRRIAGHLEECQSCAALHAELADVCAGLRAHASYVGPAVGIGTALTGKFGPAAWFAKLTALAGRAKVAVAATAVAGVGVAGLTAGGMLQSTEQSASDLSGYPGGRGDQVLPVCTSCEPGKNGPVPSPKATTTTPPPPPPNSNANHARIPAPRTSADQPERAGISTKPKPPSTQHEARGSLNEDRQVPPEPTRKPAGHSTARPSETSDGGMHVESSRLPDSTVSNDPPSSSSSSSTSSSSSSSSSSTSSDSSSTESSSGRSAYSNAEESDGGSNSFRSTDSDDSDEYSSEVTDTPALVIGPIKVIIRHTR